MNDLSMIMTQISNVDGQCFVSLYNNPTHGKWYKYNAHHLILSNVQDSIEIDFWCYV